MLKPISFSLIEETNVYKIFSDSGNSSTKVTCVLPSGEKIKIDIPTLVSNGVDKINKGSYVVRYNNRDYVIGDENKSTNTNVRLSKVNLTHKLPTFTAIHQTVPNNATIELYMGLPISSFYDEEYRQSYIDYMKEEREVTLVVNGISKTFNIKKVGALPESSGYVYNHPVGTFVGVVDIGYTTIDCAVFKDYAPIKETAFTLIDGANPFETRVRDELNKRLLLNIQRYQIQDIITNGLYGAKSQEAEKIIHECKMDYLKNIVTEMFRHNWEIETMQIVFTGGGSIYLKDVIEEFETFSLSETPFDDNRDGFAELVVLSHE